MIEDKIIKLIQALKDGPAATAEKALTAEAVWPGAEFPIAEAKMAAGTEASSNVEIYSEGNDIGSSCNRKAAHKYLHFDKYRKNIFFTPHNQPSDEHTFMNDRRASKRFNHDAPLAIKHCDSGTCSYGRMYNYSHAGIYFESDTPYQVGSRVRIEIEKSKIDLGAGLYFAEIKWCAEISAAVVLYDYGIGAEFDSKIKPMKGNEKFKVIRGGVKPNSF